MKWVARWRRTGSVAAYPMGGVKPSPLDAQAGFLIALSEDEPDLTLEEIRARLRERGVSVGFGSVWRFFDRHRISLKKNRARRRTSTP